MWAYNGAPNEALSYKAEPLTPAEVWYGERLRLPAAQSLLVQPMNKKDAEPHSYFNRVKKLLQLVRASVDSSRKLYEQDMEKRSRGVVKAKPLKVRQFQVGEEVTRYRPTKSKRINKLAPMQEGPFVVIEALANGVSYTLKRKGSDEAEVKVHVDDINSFKRWPDKQQAVTPEEAEAPEKTDSTARKFKVAEIMDERGRNTGAHQYLIRWDGAQEDGVDWECSWQSSDDLDCHMMLMEWEMATAQQKGKKRNRAKQIGVAMQVQDDQFEVRPLQLDILELVKQEGTVFEQICKILNISMDEIFFVWASPPCETYTKLDATNSSRGNGYRDHTTEGKEPRSVESCHSAADFEKRKKAINDDCMLRGLVAGFLEDNRHRHSYCFAIENPMGMLAERPFMYTDEWSRLVSKQLVHYCNYGGLFRKPTHIWTSLRRWVLGGNSGTGQCCQECQVGRYKWVDKAVRKAGVIYEHDFQIGGPNEKRSKGKKNQKC